MHTLSTIHSDVKRVVKIDSCQSKLEVGGIEKGRRMDGKGENVSDDDREVKWN